MDTSSILVAGSASLVRLWKVLVISAAGIAAPTHIFAPKRFAAVAPSIMGMKFSTDRAAALRMYQKANCFIHSASSALPAASSESRGPFTISMFTLWPVRSVY